ncbi:unnamed protein product [Allacma fusca]|uniref:FH1/FH2 domain-containing protein 3 n=1 Tax=Allacma fusca TaxID=39272 RepID=A0A8J2LIJ9_9HEXA|nr:unnamed protein product [Allacma fusca]
MLICDTFLCCYYSLDDATLQLYKDGDYGTYLDLEASISEQQEEFDGFVNNKKNSIILRAQLPVRVHAIIEKLLNSDGRELRRALFSLKQIFQEDKDLVHEFVENGGLSCLIKVGSEADQNYQNYILRAIGQVMLYVDGMCGVMRHNETIQWLYSLVASKFRLVQKTALKLLLVFVDYIESNCLLLVQAVRIVDILKGSPLWSNVMSLLRDHDSGDTELLVYAMTLVNKVLNGIPDIDTYYDQVDALEEQGMATLIQKYMGKQCADLDLLQQFQIYEVVLKHEDGEEDNIMMQLDESMRAKLLNRKGYGDVEGSGGNKERRKSRRHSANGTPPSTPTGNGSSAPFLSTHPTVRRLSSTGETRGDNDDWSSSASSSHSSSPAPNGTPNGSASPVISNGYAKDKCISNDIDVTPALRKRRERAERQKTLQLEQKQVNGKVNGYSECNGNGHTTDDSMGSPVTPSSPVKTPESITLIPLGRSNSSKKDILAVVTTNGNDNSANMNGHNNNNNNKRPWKLPVYSVTNGTTNGEKENSVEKEAGENEKNVLKRENTVKDLTQKLANQSLLTSPVEENKSFIRTGDLSGVVSKAKEGLAKSKSRVDIKPPQSSDVVNGNNNTNGILEVKKSDNELHWDFLVSNLNRPLEVCDLDFTDLTDSDDVNILAPSPHMLNGGMNGFPPPVPSMNGFTLGPPPPPPGILGKSIPPPPLNGINGILSNGRGPPAPPLFGVALKQQNNSSDLITPKSTLKKTKKTVKLFWKEVREDPVTAMKIQKVGCIWDELSPIPLDTQRLEHLFESRAKDVITKKQTDMNKCKKIVVLDPKRSNAINIGMTKLPPPRTIKAAIMKMDATIINREGIEKLLTMLPTEEERAKIQEAQFANPEIPLGSAEQFLLTLASISELTARLKLWAFKLDYENLEKEVAEPLMDLKQGVEALEKNKTFRCILTTLLCIGNFLNGAEAKGFQIEYLVKVPEVKDTVHKHSLLHHLCHMVIEKFPDSTDLYSEIGPVTRASRVDFDELATNLAKMETDCKASWDHLRVIAKHDGPTNMKLKMSEFLADCAERIIVLGIVHHRIVNRYHKFLLWLGVLAHQVTTTKPHTLFKIISEFALEYRTTRERVLQQLQKKANHRERNKTRGKMITEQIMYKTKEDKADAELRQVLKATSDTSDGDVVRGTLTWTRRQKTSQPKLHDNKNVTLNGNGTLADGDDEILESLVKTATQTPATRAAPRERKRNNSRYSDRKSLRRTLRNGLSDEDRKLLAAYMATGHRF